MQTQRQAARSLVHAEELALGPTLKLNGLPSFTPSTSNGNTPFFLFERLVDLHDFPVPMFAECGLRRRRSSERKTCRLSSLPSSHDEIAIHAATIHGHV